MYEEEVRYTYTFGPFGNHTISAHVKFQNPIDLTKNSEQ